MSLTEFSHATLIETAKNTFSYLGSFTKSRDMKSLAKSDDSANGS